MKKTRKIPPIVLALIGFAIMGFGLTMLGLYGPWHWVMYAGPITVLGYGIFMLGATQWLSDRGW